MLNSLRSRIIIFFTILIVLSTVMLALLFGIKASKELVLSYEKNAENLLEATYNHLITQHQSILFHTENTLKYRKIELKTNVNLVMSIINSYQHEYEVGTLTLNEAKQRSIDRIKSIRFLEGVGYFWINDTGTPFPKMIMHPTLSELDGLILDDKIFNNALGRDENLFKVFVDITKAHGEGYVDYLWPKPTTTGLSEIQPKISYVKIYKPWNWIIGTGVYIDDIEKEVQNRLDNVIKELNDTIPRLKVGDNGYFYIFDTNSDVLVHPYLKGKNIKDLKNPETGKVLVTELMNASKTESKSITYLWDKPDYEGKYKFEKTVFVDFYEPLGWYIVSSIYRDDLMKPIYRMAIFMIIVVIITTFLIIFLSTVIARGATNPLYRLIESISLTDENGIPVNLIPEIRTTEFNDLRITINNMLTSISIYHNQLKSIFDFSLKTMIIATDLEGLITVFNAGAENILGYLSSEMVGKVTPLKLHIQKEIVILEEELNLDCKNMSGFDILIYKTKEKGYEEREWTYIKKNGDSIRIYLIITPLKDSNNQINGYVCFAYDISEIKKQEKEIIEKNSELFRLNNELVEYQNHLEELVKERTSRLEASLDELKQTQTQLIESEKMASLGGLVAGVAHEINTPVGIGVTAASHLEMETNNFKKLYSDGHLSKSQLESFLQMCLDSSRIILSNMIKSSELIKSFKQVAVDQISEEKRMFKIKTYMDEVLLSIHSKYKNTSHRVVVNSDSDYYVYSYPGVIYQVINNLITNSLIHGFESLESGIIEISIHKEGRYIIIHYKDSGRGIPEEILKKIYDPFFTTNRSHGGSGLGLHIVYNLINRNLEGFIECKSVVGEFTEFYIKFPHNIVDDYVI